MNLRFCLKHHKHDQRFIYKDVPFSLAKTAKVFPQREIVLLETMKTQSEKRITKAEIKRTSKSGFGEIPSLHRWPLAIAPGCRSELG